MRITAKIKLVTDANQNASLFGTMALANKCCNWLSEKAWKRSCSRLPDFRRTSTTQQETHSGSYLPDGSSLHEEGR